MKTSRIQIGATVFNKKNQEGHISRIITKSTGYVEVIYNDGSKKKEMAFNLTGEDGQPLKSTPKPAKPRVLTTSERIQKQKEKLLNVRETWAASTTSVIVDILNGHRTDDTFIDSLIDAWFKAKSSGWNFSEKQAYYLAKYMVENDLAIV